MKNLFFLVGILLSNSLQAQSPKSIESTADSFNNHVKYLNKGEYDHIEGSPYENANFTEVEVGNIGKVAGKLRYNAVTDQMEFMKDGKVYNLNYLPNQLISFNSGIGPHFKFITYKFKDGAEEGYVKVLVDGEKYKLLKRELKYVKNNSNKTQVNQRDTTFEIDNKPVEYILEFDNKLIKFPKNAKALQSSIGLKNQDLITKLEKFNFSNQKDLVEIVELLN